MTTQPAEASSDKPSPEKLSAAGPDPHTTAGKPADLERRHPGVRDRLLDEKGVRRFVNLYVGDEDIRFLEGLETALQGGEQISIVPAIAGG